MQFADFDVFVAHRVGVIGEQDVALNVGAEIRDGLEFAVLNGFEDFGAAQFVDENLFSVEPVLDMISVN